MRNNLQETFGNIDIYLFDQLLKGRFDHSKKILDVGCGDGRNLYYFLRNGYEVFGVDPEEKAIDTIKKLSASLAPDIPEENFTISSAENLHFADATFDLIVCNAVLHFAKDQQHFGTMLRSMFRVLKPGGYFFSRLASDIGIETFVRSIGNGRYSLPDGTERFLVNEQTLLKYTKEFGSLYEPLKTTNVHNLRCMTTWCVQKS